MHSMSTTCVLIPCRDLVLRRINKPSNRTGAGMFAHTSPGTSGRHIVEELLWYDRFRFSDKLLASCINLSRVVTGQLVAS